MQVQLTAVHYIYLLMIVVVIVTMAFRKDTVLPCIIGLFAIGVAATGSLLKGIQIIYEALIAAGNEFWSIILIISLVVAMSKALADIGADMIIMGPAIKVMKNPTIAFWALGIFMMVVSWFIWPSPAVALIGAILLPVARRAGLPAVGAAAAMNIFGHGIALSGDFFIQGAPAITGKAAGLADTGLIIRASLPLWLVMSGVTAVTAFLLMKKEFVQKTVQPVSADNKEDRPKDWKVTAIALITAAAFVIDIILMVHYQLRGGDATALIGGTAILIMALSAVVQHQLVNSLDKISDHIREGFTFGIRIFAPVIVIGGFFFLGSEGTAKAILGPEARGLLTDFGNVLAQNVALSKVPIAFIQLVIGAITGLDGSGFSGLPLVGSLAKTFSTAVPIDTARLAALGQISAIWVGGGTIIPWGLIPVAAICGVDPHELARKNFIPVLIGFAVTLVVSFFLL